MPTISSSSIARASAAVLIHAHVGVQRLGDLPADGQDRVEGGHRVLEDHGDFFTADVLPSRL